MQKLPLTCISFGLGPVKTKSAQHLGGSGAVCEGALCYIDIKHQRLMLRLQVRSTSNDMAFAVLNAAFLL